MEIEESKKWSEAKMKVCQQSISQESEQVSRQKKLQQQKLVSDVLLGIEERKRVKETEAELERKTREKVIAYQS